MKTTILLSLSVGLVLASACSNKDEDREDRVAALTGQFKKATGAAGTATPVAPATPAGPAAPAFDANDAYLALMGARYRTSLWRVHAGQVMKVELVPRCRYFTRIQAAPDGHVWVYCGRTYRISGSSMQEQSAGDTPSGVGDFGFSPKDGTVYYASKKGLFSFTKGKWTAEGLPPEAIEGRATPKLAIDAKGRPWIAASTGVWVKDGTFRRVDLPAERQPAPYRKIVATKAGVWVEVRTRIGSALLRVDGGARTQTKLGERYLILSALAANPAGGLVARSSDKLIWADEEGKPQRRLNLKRQILGHANALEVDGTGRTWLGTSLGPVLIDAQGAVHQWEPGRVPGLSLYRVKAIVVAGKGPTLPTLGPKVRGTVKGQIRGAGAGVAVEMCPGAGVLKKFYGRTPCIYDALRVRATTDAQGNFVFENVAPYPMKLVVSRGRGRWGLKRPRCCTGVKAGQTLDIGGFGS